MYEGGRDRALAKFESADSAVPWRQMKDTADLERD
jgi:hypothetical protein